MPTHTNNENQKLLTTFQIHMSECGVPPWLQEKMFSVIEEDKRSMPIDEIFETLSTFGATTTTALPEQFYDEHWLQMVYNTRLEWVKEEIEFLEEVTYDSLVEHLEYIPPPVKAMSEQAQKAYIAVSSCLLNALCQIDTMSSAGKTSKYSKDSMQKNVYLAPMFPGLVGIFAVLLPFWSTDLFYIWLGVMGALIVWMFFAYLVKAHRDPSKHALLMVFHMDLAAFCCLLPFWRLVGSQTWVAMLLVVSYLFVMLLTHFNKRVVAKELFGRGGGRLKGRIFTFSFLIPSVLVGSILIFPHYYQDLFGYDKSTLVLSLGMLPFAYIMVVFFHCLWARVEDPQFDANKS
ncbi:hypothetical protein [Aureibacillus halotolerans]|uniref:Uncharacterized protein n=1 Tax=Aureibacillus halotolerans TaxID=1508390 RepID=A0A4V3D695_9BACI|nr:hypothetical protein [Aureibacillus halotolerans]TDQ43037.1 hypothetical protein EV213_101469 [Aureibacillus halotolerans]